MKLEENNKVYVDEMFAELIPFFLQNRRNEIPELEDMCERHDFEALARMGHKLYGCSKTYGFSQLGDYALELEKAGLDKNEKLARRTIDGIRSHLGQVDIIFVSALDQNSEVAQ